ncbi:MAG: UDP-N-acetylmuramoyl-tripeptide--D-alanyl-D-alanine ligase, partial [Flavobacteriia bacterium]|nr:UDP-N-acetylmuramoyl-tripeptide--D-alanyl-D-alanine ligase [Flavobacteriia bacterium]
MDKFHELFLASSGVCTDTRAIFTDCFFVCLKGDRFDANTFAEEALALGAKYVISSDAHRCNNRDIYFVSDTLIFLQSLAHFHRKKFNIPILGITGSNGKTTTKELVNA